MNMNIYDNLIILSILFNVLFIVILIISQIKIINNAIRLDNVENKVYKMIEKLESNRRKLRHVLEVLPYKADQLKNNNSINTARSIILQTYDDLLPIINNLKEGE